MKEGEKWHSGNACRAAKAAETSAVEEESRRRT